MTRVVFGIEIFFFDTTSSQLGAVDVDDKTLGLARASYNWLMVSPVFAEIGNMVHTHYSARNLR
jgi:hypothetical protein